MQGFLSKFASLISTSHTYPDEVLWVTLILGHAVPLQGVGEAETGGVFFTDVRTAWLAATGAELVTVLQQRILYGNFIGHISGGSYSNRNSCGVFLKYLQNLPVILCIYVLSSDCTIYCDDLWWLASHIYNVLNMLKECDN